MGALRKLLPITAALLHRGLAGHRRRAAVLRLLVEGRHPALRLRLLEPVLWFIGFVTALLTAYYMTRQVMMVFYGEARWTEARPEPVDDCRAAMATLHGDDHGHAVTPHESPWLMWLPLVVLAIGGLRRRGHQPALRRPRLPAPAGWSRWSRAASARSARPPRTTSGSCSRLAGDLRPRRHLPRLPGLRPAPAPGRSSRPSWPTAGTTTRPSPRSWADPGRRLRGHGDLRRQGHRRRGRRHRARHPGRRASGCDGARAATSATTRSASASAPCCCSAGSWRGA